MRTKARVLQGLGTLLAVGAALFAGVPGAGADDALPVPAPPHLISAVVTGCHAPCAIGQSGEVVLTWEQSPPPSNDVGVDYREYSNDFRLAEVDWMKHDSNTTTVAIPICASDWSTAHQRRVGAQQRTGAYPRLTRTSISPRKSPAWLAASAINPAVIASQVRCSKGRPTTAAARHHKHCCGGRRCARPGMAVAVAGLHVRDRDTRGRARE